MSGNDESKRGSAERRIGRARERATRATKARRVAAILGTLVLWLAVDTAAAQTARYRWNHKSTERGVALYTSDVATHSFAAVKGVAILPLGEEPLLATLYDFARYPSWYHHCADVKVLSAPAQAPQSASARLAPRGQSASVGPWVLYFRQRAPPLGDRWAILHAFYRERTDQTILIDFKPVTSVPFKAPRDLVRMQLYGYWELKPLDASHTQVTFVIDVDPQTSAAGFLVNPVLRDTVFETLLGLERAASRVRH